MRLYLTAALRWQRPAERDARERDEEQCISNSVRDPLQHAFFDARQPNIRVGKPPSHDVTEVLGACGTVDSIGNSAQQNAADYADRQ